MRARAGAAVLVAALAAPATAMAIDCPDAGVLATPDTARAVGDAIVCLIGAWRTDEGRVPLRRSVQLDTSSQRHSTDMVARHYLAHERRGGPTVLDRIRASGYFDHAVDGLYSENIGVVPDETASAQTLFDAWMSSPEHRENIAHVAFRDIGVGIAFAPPDPAFYRDYASAVVTTDFGQRTVRVRKARHVLRCAHRKRRRAHPYCARHPRG